MKKKYLILLIGLLITNLSLAQEEVRLFYDSEWKGTVKKDAEYYRIFSINDKGQPVGPINDFFITGELQSKIDGASYIDKNDDSNSKFKGYSVGYFKSGIKEFEILHDEYGNVITHKIWYDNGNKRLETSYLNGEYHGKYNLFYESGKLYRQFEFNKGELKGKFFTECDEFQSCQKVFYEAFSTKDNPNEWPIINDNKDFQTKIIAEKGLLMENKSEQGFRETIRIPLNLNSDFSIETILEFKSGSKNSGHGLMWGFKDWNNYYYFYISANGFYKIGAKTEGINLEFAQWTESSSINQNYQRNLIKVLRVDDKLFFSINGSVVHTEDFYGFTGNQIGFSIDYGEKTILFENLIVKQDIDQIAETTNNNNLNDVSSWKGNGTGFFIDTRGYIATNYHVVKEANNIEIEFYRDGVKNVYPAEIVQSDRHNDISIIKINSNLFKPFQHLPYNIKTDISEVGNNVFALGYPMALSLMGSEIKFTDGKISSKTGLKGDVTTYQISVPIQPGNSGGPLFDYDGNVIGITSSGVNRELNITENVNYAIKSSYLKNLVDVLNYKLTIPRVNLISNKTLTEKIKILSEYVVLIKIK